MKTKALTLGIAVAVSSSFALHSPQANAIIPVTDYAHIVQTINVLKQMIQEYQLLQQQLAEAKATAEALKGGRGMGNIARTNDLMVGSDWQIVLNGNLSGSTERISDQILREANQLGTDYYNDVDPSAKEGMATSMRTAANGAALNATVFDQAKDRQQKLISLVNRVDSTADAKASADLSARIAGEQSMLTNELIRLQAMNASRDEQRRVDTVKSIQGANYFGSAAIRGSE